MPDHVHAIFEIQTDVNHKIGPYTFMANDNGMPPVEADDREIINNMVMAPVGAHDFDIADKTVMAPVGAHDFDIADKTVMAPVGAHDFDIADKTVMAPVGAHSCAPLQPPMRLFRRPQSVSSCVAQYKATTTRIINRMRNIKGVRVWQRNFNDRIIRDQEELDYYRIYIRDNPKNGKGGKSIL